MGRNPEAVRRYISGDTIAPAPSMTLSADPWPRPRSAVAPQTPAAHALKSSKPGSGRSVVSTTIARKDSPAHDGDNILLADDPSSFAAAVSSLLEAAASDAAAGPIRARAELADRLARARLVGRALSSFHRLFFSSFNQFHLALRCRCSLIRMTKYAPIQMTTSVTKGIAFGEYFWPRIFANAR